ncbi:MAG: heavy-metal-associated domain-containing protein [Anaerolineales bacterium]|nr:heavy-metal-associated domain-containing protein [Anaerolineales bacterium]
MNTIVYNVPKIHCGHCTQTIENELAELPGVEAVKASLEDKKVMVRFVEPATDESVKALLAEINYPVA